MTLPSNVNHYIDEIEDKTKQQATRELIEVIHSNLPEGFELGIYYNMPTWYIPFEIYPIGYHCEDNMPLPFLSVAAQKKHIAVYHMGIYGDPELLKWFENEYPKHMTTKLNMGKSCIRFTNSKKVPFELIRILVGKITPEQYIQIYEQRYK
ncbi:DUF1801 domain-containing protein [Staphylococcus massiliensis]|uniref:YdhG-like domain-containing protein n=1 Tax=Staphylococcus massiliensis S46 TaxID=1229783 RepID=K9AQ87_9STAP|nr:DUF1801 domain-containing protein [Staphylococcus massiliensis]EKU48191.1 hypothetical protein C273_05777 [Staphylococcus massiliensis S46]MCG3399548.1 DUF1801 domain-containing protein [Staphylococcus massiliensis]MCG3402058.1 DUF1801 domain-containing protein [Staphylococcus massiliensis]MCG3412691.1 DUF1801 domain-containing protein [Staphylococcus massiliensis]POA01004.1 DUF1801 domain-containing protein [Staphylococcus massiliensis CCUG 55927]